MNPWNFLLPGLIRWRSGLSDAQQPVNSYVWNQPAGAVVIDPSADLTPEKLRGIGVNKVTDILITHFQAENAAGCCHFPDARIHVPAGDEYLAEGTEAGQKLVTSWPPPWDWTARGNFPGHVAGAVNERPASRALRLDASLIPGATSAGFHILATPGHGKHAVTLIADIAGRRVGFCGDLIFEEGRLWNWFDSEWDYGLQAGQQELLRSCERLREENPDVLCPSHGGVIQNPDASLRMLGERLSRVLDPSPPPETAAVNFPDRDSPAPGFREILPCLHQYREGNCAILVSQSRQALMVDDGLCFWRPQAEREAHHRVIIGGAKRALGIHRIEMVIPTHYHGDHTENIPALVDQEGAEIVCLERTAGPIERPDQFNLACPLSWYGTAHESFAISRKLPDHARFRWHEFELEIFHIGGQTDYALGVQVVLHGLRTLFVGDAIDYRSPLCEPVLCYNKADPETAGWVYGLERMIERRPDLLVCGHGSAIRNPLPLLLKKREAWRQRLKEFRALSARTDLREFFDPFCGNL